MPWHVAGRQLTNCLCTLLQFTEVAKVKYNFKTDKHFSQAFFAKKGLETQFKTQRIFVPLITKEIAICIHVQ